MNVLDKQWEQFFFAILVLVIAFVVGRILRYVLGRFLRASARKIKVDPTRYNFFKNAVSSWISYHLVDAVVRFVRIVLDLQQLADPAIRVVHITKQNCSGRASRLTLGGVALWVIASAPPSRIKTSFCPACAAPAHCRTSDERVAPWQSAGPGL